jgi:hypothetical protein
MPPVVPSRPAQPSGEPAPVGKVPVGTAPIAPMDMIIYPQEYSQYQAYLDVIGARPRAADTAIIEATVTSILTSDICPYHEEDCRIEPYPSDWGTVRVEKILDYAAYGEHPEGAEAEQPDQPKDSGAENTAGHSGIEPAFEGRLHEPLQVGQEVQTQFVLTARPAKVRYVPAGGSEGIEPMQYTESGAGEMVEHPVVSGEAVFNPISREGQYYVFTTNIGDYAAPVETVLPGLDAGARFRARIRYDGILYVEEYELVP